MNMLLTWVCVMVLILQESVELLGQFKEFMVKYNKVYSSQEGELMSTHIQHIRVWVYFQFKQIQNINRNGYYDRPFTLKYLLIGWTFSCQKFFSVSSKWNVFHLEENPLPEWVDWIEDWLTRTLIHTRLYTKTTMCVL